MRKTYLLIIMLLCGLFVGSAPAATYKLNDGRSITGDLIESGSNEAVAMIKVEDGKYEKVGWGEFSQEDLKAFKDRYASSRKIRDAVEPFIDIPEETRAAKTEVNIKAVPRLEIPPRGSLIGSLFKSGLGLFLILLIYAANIYAGYEISIFRAQPTPLVTGLAAIPVLGVVSNVVFVSMPTRLADKSGGEVLEAGQAASEHPPTIALPGQETSDAHSANAGHPVAAVAKAEVFSRGQFTFNKRFFETKFPNFFGMIRRDEDKGKVLLFKTAKGEFVAQRISRLTPSEIHIQTDRGGVSTEVSFLFSEVQEVVLKPAA